MTTGELSVTNGAQLQTVTFGQGNAGSIIINATKSVSLDGSLSDIFSSVGLINNSLNNLAKGNGGNIQITTNELFLTNGAALEASTFGQSNAGNVIINANKSISLNNGAILSNVGNVDNPRNDFAKGNAGNIQITTNELSLTNGGQLQASTFGQGNAGNIQISTDQLSLTNGGQLQASTFGQGNAGNVIINATKSVALDRNGAISSSVGSISNGLAKGNSGNIQITTDQLSLTNGSQLLVVSFAQGSAGNVIINATNRVFLDGQSTDSTGNHIHSGIFSDVPFNSLILQQPNNFIEVQGGNIEINTPLLELNNGAQLSAKAFFGNAGNITLAPNNLLLLQHGSLISTLAGLENGGNITINTPNGFVVATNRENNDITANSFLGSGGVIKINAQGIYNFNQRSRQDLENLLGTNDFTKLDPQLLPTNDITAVSLRSTALSGQVNIITPDIDPSRGLITLPTVTENAPKLVSSNCAAFNELAGGSNFTITGRGGLPPSPDEPLTSDVVWSDTRLPTTTQHQHKTHEAKPKPKPIAIIPATGWVFNGKGEVTLISTATNATASNTPFSCPAR